MPGFKTVLFSIFWRQDHAITVAVLVEVLWGGLSALWSSYFNLLACFLQQLDTIAEVPPDSSVRQTLIADLIGASVEWDLLLF